MAASPFKRADRLSASIRDIVAEILRARIADPRLRSVMITHVDFPSDLQQARVYWYFLKGATDAKIAAAESAFAKATGLFESAVARELQLKRSPDLQFRYDKGIDHERHIEALLDEVGASKPPDDTSR